MTINVSVHYNGGFLLDMIWLTLSMCYYHWGTRLNAINMFLSFQPMFPPKRFDTPPLSRRCSEGFDLEAFSYVSAIRLGPLSRHVISHL